MAYSCPKVLSVAIVDQSGPTKKLVPRQRCASKGVKISLKFVIYRRRHHIIYILYSHFLIVLDFVSFNHIAIIMIFLLFLSMRTFPSKNRNVL